MYRANAYQSIGLQTISALAFYTELTLNFQKLTSFCARKREIDLHVAYLAYM